jgi:hypothetical protein
MDFCVQGQPGLQSEFQDSQSCTEKPCLEKPKEEEEEEEEGEGEGEEEGEEEEEKEKEKKKKKKIVSFVGRKSHSQNSQN